MSNRRTKPVVMLNSTLRSLRCDAVFELRIGLFSALFDEPAIVIKYSEYRTANCYATRYYHSISVLSILGVLNKYRYRKTVMAKCTLVTILSHILLLHFDIDSMALIHRAYVHNIPGTFL